LELLVRIASNLRVVTAIRPSAWVNICDTITSP
jgi:hypothetical protein